MFPSPFSCLVIFFDCSELLLSSTFSLYQQTFKKVRNMFDPPSSDVRAINFGSFGRPWGTVKI